MNSKCILPWIHMQIDSDGSTRPCCNSAKGSSPMGNVLTDNIVSIWNNENYKLLRRQMISMEEPAACKPCYDSERLGLYSKRLRENDDWKKYNHLTTSEEAPFKIRHLDVRFDNVCNFKCRYCSPWLSHSWYNDYIKMNIPVRTEQAININGNDLYKIIHNNVVDDLEHVFFCGGEPLIMDQHLELLKELDRRKKYDTRLLYITNLSRLSYKGTNYIDIWNKFNDVNIHCSIDAVGPNLEYIRHGSKWTTIEKNLKILFDNKEKLKPKIGITVSIYNASDIVDTVEFLVSTGYINYDDISLQVIDKPKIYSPQILPNELKKKITKDVNDFLTRTDLPKFFKSRYEYFINSMNSEDLYDTYKLEFIETTKKLDAIRGENFHRTFTNLNYYYD